jgi:hypothetical protein
MTDPNTINSTLTLLKAEVDLDFEGLVQALEAGPQTVIVTTEGLVDKNLDPDALRRIGGMTMLCSHYGAVVVFLKEKKFVRVNLKDFPD